jgi:hypothetical protein
VIRTSALLLHVGGHRLARYIDPDQDSRDIVPHGFRSSFGTWADEWTSAPNAVSEAALGHAKGDKVEAAYKRGDLFAKRRDLMEAWAEFCAGKARGTVGHVTWDPPEEEPSNVVPIKARVRRRP